MILKKLDHFFTLSNGIKITRLDTQHTPNNLKDGFLTGVGIKTWKYSHDDMICMKSIKISLTVIKISAFLMF